MKILWSNSIMISWPRAGPAVAQSEWDRVVRVRQGRGGEGGSKILEHSPCFRPSLETLLQLFGFFCTTVRQTGSMSCPGRCGALCGYSSSGCGRPNHQGAQPNHHHHHSHFDRWGEEASYITPRALCGSGWGVPGGGSSGKLGAMQHYHRFLLLRDLISPRSIRVMAETYAADRDRSEREKERASGATGIPFSHATSVQGNPMRAGGWSSSSRYHRQCSREEAEWSDRVPSYWDLLQVVINSDQLY